MERKKLTMIVCTHKQSSTVRTKAPYLPVHCGRALSHDLGFQGDDTGDNISERNPMYSELTGLYWMWKNIHDSDYVGLVHYRRYLDADINDATIDSLMKGYDILVANDHVFSHHLATGIYWHIPRESFWIMADTLLSMHPECSDTFIDYFFFYNRLTPHCMFVSRRQLMDEYCSFIFPVFFETEKKLRGTGYSRGQRVFAYFGEWMLGFYIAFKKLKVKHLPIFYAELEGKGPQQDESDLSGRIISRLHYKYDCHIETASFRLTNLWKPRQIKADDDIIVGLRNDGISLEVLDKVIKHS